MVIHPVQRRENSKSLAVGLGLRLPAFRMPLFSERHTAIIAASQFPSISTSDSAAPGNQRHRQFGLAQDAEPSTMIVHVLKYKSRFWLLVSLAVAFGLRVHLLDGQSLWNDEGTSVALAACSLPTIVESGERLCGYIFRTREAT